MTVASRIVTIAGRKFDIALDDDTSERLGRQRRVKTKPEEAVRRILRALHIRLSTTNRDLPGSPDFADRSRRWALFVHGCYWHHHRGCRRATIPSTNRAFWVAKFEDNRRRDQRAVRALRRLGYSVTVIWECRVGQKAGLEARLRRLAGRRDGDENQ